MTYNEFKNKYNGKFVDYDGAYGNQCWDLGQYYFTKVLNLPSSVLSGCGLVSNMLYPPKRNLLDKYFVEINIKDIKQGDVCIWEYGHIAIFDHKSGSSYYYFSQNPNPSKVIRIVKEGVHVFRLRSESKDLYLNLSGNVTSWTVYKTNKYYNKSKKSDILIILNPHKFGGLSYRILEDMGNYHFKINTSNKGIGYIAGNPYKYPCTISDKPKYKNGNY